MAKDFSITVISSTFFYLLLVVIPKSIKQHFVRRRTQSTIDYIANTMQEIIDYLVHKCSLPQKSDDPHYLKIDLKVFDSIADISRENQTGFYYSSFQNSKKELINVSNWDELSFLYSRTGAIERVVSNYLDIPGIVYEKQQLVFLVRQIGRCLFVENIEIKCKNSLPIRINEMPDSIKVFYSLYQSLCGYTKKLQELNVKDKDAANVNPIPMSYCSCHKSDFRLTNK